VGREYADEEGCEQGELFICDVSLPALKDVVSQLEHPFYSLSKKIDTKIRRYEYKGNWIQIVPSVKGMATIYDKDILIYVISQLVAKRNRGEVISRKVKINTRDLLKFTRRADTGGAYKAVVASIERLAGTRISTNIVVPGVGERYDNFGLIEAGSVERKNGLDGRLVSISLTVSEWVFAAVMSRKGVLTLSSEYFKIKKPIDKRIYEIVRKHCGDKYYWKVSVEVLFRKSGTMSQRSEFARAMRRLVAENRLPDYTVSYDRESKSLIFSKRAEMQTRLARSTAVSLVDGETTHRVVALMLGIAAEEVQGLEEKWVAAWREGGCPDIPDTDGEFIAFARKYMTGRRRLGV